MTLNKIKCSYCTLPLHDSEIRACKESIYMSSVMVHLCKLGQIAYQYQLCEPYCSLYPRPSFQVYYCKTAFTLTKLICDIKCAQAIVTVHPK